MCPKWVPPEEEQELNESRRFVLFIAFLLHNRPHPHFVSFRLWYNLTQAIIAKDMEKATEAKSAVEDAQREQRRRMEENHQKHIQTFFEQRDGRWVPRIEWVFFPPLSSVLVVLLLIPCGEGSRQIQWLQHNLFKTGFSPQNIIVTQPRRPNFSQGSFTYLSLSFLCNHSMCFCCFLCMC